MGTFHDHKSPLHGITVVVDTKGPKVFVGRCDDEDQEKVILVDADSHDDGAGGKSKADYIKRAAKFGVWKKFEHLVIPRADVQSITRLGDVHETTVKAAAPVAVAAPVPAPKPVEAPKSTEGLVTVTPSAQVEVKKLLDQQNKPGLGLRITALASRVCSDGLRLVRTTSATELASSVMSADGVSGSNSTAPCRSVIRLSDGKRLV